MKILYGVQATGNGHITRARAMQPALARRGVEVDFLFTGRSREKLFDMDAFGRYDVRRGLTFAIERGRVNLPKTVLQANLLELVRDVRTLDLSPYDLVLTDFEPVSAWAARRSGKPCIGIGHQYAFPFDIPKAGDSWAAQQVMKWFAPASISLGAHWHHFNSPILPPLMHPTAETQEADSDQILVYLPFEEAADIMDLLEPITDYRFHVFTDALPPGVQDNIEIHPFGRDNFQQKLQACQSVLCNAGFELASEALQLGRRILVKPMHGQMEQASNAKALQELGYGTAANQLTTELILHWMRTAPCVQIRYPDVADAVAQWVASGDWSGTENLVNSLWRQVDFGTHMKANNTHLIT
ncbi:glycosyltransferase [Salinispirillum sp. LH 10-3-1]|uniref:Glycosyltransferase n=1 Tax=Salinispirillum sp. LH 10-3-1 TaxID=2952525 RepID=A0AB38YJJ7_9GAMM